MKIVKRVPIKKKTFEGVKHVKKTNKNLLSILLIVVLVAVIGYSIFFQGSDIMNNVGDLFKSDPVAARVDGNAIRLSEVDEEYAKVPEMYKQMFTKQLILEQIISQHVLLEEASRQAIKMTRDEMDQIMNDAIVQSGMTPSQFEEVLEAQGTSMADLRKLYELSLIIDTLITQEVIALIEVTDEEIALYYEDNKESFFNDDESIQAEHILISVESRSEESALEIAQEVYDLAIIKGSDFEALAVEYSDDPSVISNKGDLGFFSKGMMVLPFETAAFGLEIGEISEPVQTQFGYHLIKKIDEALSGYLILEEARPQIDTILNEAKQQDAVETYIQVLREQAKIEYGENFEPASIPTLDITTTQDKDVVEDTEDGVETADVSVEMVVEAEPMDSEEVSDEEVVTVEVVEDEPVEENVSSESTETNTTE